MDKEGQQLMIDTVNCLHNATRATTHEHDHVMRELIAWAQAYCCALHIALSNHLVPGAILMPGAVGTLVELASSGFAYAR